MARPWRVRYAGAKYHLTVRGNGRAAVFLDPGDYERFLEQLDAALEADGVVLYAYVLMPNHLNSERRLATRGGAPRGVRERVGGR